MSLHAFGIPIGGASGFLFNSLNINAGGVAEKIKDMHNVLLADASQELLLYNAYPGFQNLQGETTLLNPKHTAFYDELADMGPLSAVRVVRIANGAEDGTEGSTAPYEEIFSVDAGSFKLISLGAEELYDFLHGNSGVGLQIKGPFVFISSVLAIMMGYGAEARIEGRALPDNISHLKTIYDGKISFKVLFGLVSIKSTHDARVRHTRPYDSAPGGTLDLLSSSGGNVTLPDFVDFPGSVISFTPNVSSMHWIDQELDYNFTAEYGTPNAAIRADKISASDAGNPGGKLNTPHVSLTPRISNLMIIELISGQGPATTVIGNGEHMLTENYNFGVLPDDILALPTPNELIRPHVIPNNRTLYVNRDLPLGNVDNPDNPAAATGIEDYEFFLRDGFDCNGPTGPAHLTVAQGGQLLVGDWAAGNTATVIVEDYASISVDGYMELDRFSTLLVKAHTTLRIAGRVRLNADARIIVEPGGILTVQPGGELDLGSRARVEVASNAFLWHRSAGIIKAGVDAEVIIEEGARYQLFEGSEVRLWSGQNPYGTACIRLFGIVHWNGEPHFSGNGHFSFEQGAQLFIPFPDDPNGPREFRLRGQRPDFRFLTVKSLQVPKGVDVHLSRGIIQSSGLYTFGGYIEFENTHWHGSTGLDAEAPQRVIARRSTFTGMTGALSVREATQPTVGTTVRECTFTRCQTGLYIENSRYNVEVIESTFDGGATTEATGLEAIWGVNARKIHVTDTDIFGYVRSMVDDQTGAVEHAAVTLDGVRDLELIGDSLNRLRAANLILLRVKKPRLIYG